MEVLLNDKSIRMQFTEDTFIEYIRAELLPIMKMLVENNAALLKEYSTYNCKVTRRKTAYEFVNIKGNPIIDRIKDHLVQLTCIAPFWNDSICTRTDVDYICDIEEVPNCITEAYERKGILLSFINGGFDKTDIDIKCAGESEKVRNFYDLKGLKQHLSDLGMITLWNNNSFNVDSIGYKFEIRFREDNHNMPHFHLTSNDEAASISIPDADIIAGELRNPQKAISWSLQNMKNITELWNQYHPEKAVEFIN